MKIFDQGFEIANGIRIGEGRMVLFSGPCAIESWEVCARVAESLKETCERLDIGYIFKASFDKANRTSVDAYRGVGFEEGLAVLDRISTEFDLPIVTDIHEASQAKPVSDVAQALQIPAYLCRQTDLLVAAGETGKVVKIKRGQFMAAEDMQYAVAKVRSTGNDKVLLTERGVSFGYHNLVVDMRALPTLRQFAPVVFDVTHSVQQPGGAGGSSSGQKEFAPYLCRAAGAAGVDAFFIETHPDPLVAKSDGPNMIPLHKMNEFLTMAKAAFELGQHANLNLMIKAIKQLLAFAVLAILASSCIPNEKVIYLQNKDDLPELGLDTLIALQRQAYKLQPNDILLINFYAAQQSAVEKYYPLLLRTNALGTNMVGGIGRGGNAQQNLYFTGYNVDKDGLVEINALGRIQAAGLTTDELKYKLEEIIREQEGVTDILVNVKLDGIRYTIFGEVLLPGPQILQQYEANLMEAIATSGDLTLNANRANVQIIRQYPDGVRIHEVDVTRRDLLESKYYFLQPNDIIYVPPLKIRELGTGDSFLEIFASVVAIISGTALIINLINQ
jgi:3-deoxy-8-phosphooctulonate synthase